MYVVLLEFLAKDQFYVALTLKSIIAFIINLTDLHNCKNLIKFSVHVFNVVKLNIMVT